jgi:hypothetical protein
MGFSGLWFRDKIAKREVLKENKWKRRLQSQVQIAPEEQVFRRI